jgi:hypothetical protein
LPLDYSALLGFLPDNNLAEPVYRENVELRDDGSPGPNSATLIPGSWSQYITT